jgi:hypothetical protein
MAIRLNQEAVEHAQNLIKGRQYERNSDWSEAQPSAEEENKFIGENGWEAFAKWHLAYDTEARIRDQESLQVSLWRLQELASQRPHRRQTARWFRRLQRGPKRRRQAAREAPW